MHEAKDNHPETVELNKKNVLILGTVLFFVMGLIYYTYADSKKDFDERMAKYNQMTTQEMAMYLADLNAEPEQIDPITRHTGTQVKGTTIYFYRELTSNILSDMIVDVENIKAEKIKMSRQLKREMCGSPTYDLFYSKGGDLTYIYHQVQNNKNFFLFAVEINKISCI